MVCFQETCGDERKRSGTKRIGVLFSYSTSIGVVFGSLKIVGGYFQQVEMDVDFVIRGISSTFNDNW